MTTFPVIQDYNFTSREQFFDGSVNSGPFTDPNYGLAGAWSTFMNTYNVGGTDGYPPSGTPPNEYGYAWNIYFNNFGRQKFYAAGDNEAKVYINGVWEFDTGHWTGQSSKTTWHNFAPGEYVISVIVTNSYPFGPYGAALQWYDFDPPDPPNISSFYATPNPQNSSSGVPQYSTTLSFSSSGLGLTSANITSSAGDDWDEYIDPGNTWLHDKANGTRSITDLPQSNANGTSPTERDYTFEVCNSGGCVSSTITVEAYNDNTLSNVSSNWIDPSWTTSFIFPEPDTVYTETLGTLSGVDMPTIISTSGDSNYVGNDESFSGSRSFNNGDTLQLRTTSLPFNTNMSGVDANATLGNTNSKTIEVTTPSGTFDVTCTTRAPVVKEIFDYADRKDEYPYEDIDFITNSPTEHLVSDQIEANDIEIPMEIKVDKPDAQVRINNGDWQDVRSM